MKAFKMRKFLVFSLFIVANKIYCQTAIYSSSADLRDTSIDRDIEKIKLPWGNWGNNISVIYKNGNRQVLKKRSVWGFRRSGEKEIKRFYNGQIFDIVDTGIIVIYKTWSRHPVYYFSLNMDSEIKYLKKKKIMDALGDETFLAAYQKSPVLRKVLDFQ